MKSRRADGTQTGPKPPWTPGVRVVLEIKMETGLD